ncbi:Clp protease [Methylosinus sp. R-45379]|uniref:AAA family ATPase n=1 Tax=unclassified Methylosinus TaxID=2624500 RepID=UPI000464B847|nr:MULTISPECIES: AAA family ATPase [unclassified Methylosinus]MBG0810818.1 ATP-dependent Clp protease ATP-binding subunit [Methylosinus sp. H3A]OAI23856.1 Clp protease [Methylosinus sp. R-45379]TDX65977.1 Cdc48 subfamily AAA family protein [Methylosinus sp. sav-2]
MQRLLSALTRYAPLLLLPLWILSTLQLAIQSGVTTQSANAFLTRGSWFYFAVATMAWAAVVAGLLHAGRAWPRFLSHRWIMDILDRLTNKNALERLVAGESRISVLIDANDLRQRLKAKVIGQDEVCDDIAAQIRRRLALSLRNRPVGVFLFAGSPGTGKTYLGKCLAVALDRPLLHLDMTQFSSPLASTQIFGSPQGYAGSDSYGKLTAMLRNHPEVVVLLDEFEKAHDEVHKKFLTAWNDGFVTEASDGRQISTTRAIFIVTTNAATEQLTKIAKAGAGAPDEIRRASVEALKAESFAPEVLNRIDRIFVFAPLRGLDVARVAALEIEAMIAGYGLSVADGGIDAHLLFDIMQRHERLGAAASSRDLARAIEDTISDSLIEAKQRNAQRVMLVNDGGRVVVEPA